MTKRTRKVIVNNKKAFHDYHIEERYEAGIVLTGTEIKSIRKGSCSIKDHKQGRADTYGHAHRAL